MSTDSLYARYRGAGPASTGFGQLGPAGDHGLYVQLHPGAPLQPVTQEFIDAMHHDGMVSLALAGRLDDAAAIKWLQADAARQHEATERTYLEAARLEASLPKAPRVATATEIALAAHGFTDRSCRVCKTTFSATGDRNVCNAHAHLAGR